MQAKSMLSTFSSCCLSSLAHLGATRLGAATVVTAALTLSACTKDEPAPVQEEGCVSDLAYFDVNVWRPIMRDSCFGCHSQQGIANQTDLVLQSPNQPGFLEHNFDVVKNIGAFERDGTSVLLLKPTLTIDHGGGQVFEVGSEKYKTFEELLNRFDNPTVCDESQQEDFYATNVILADPASTFRKASVLLSDRMPTAEENAALADGGDDALDNAMDGLMSEEAFYERLREIFNDKFLTDRYLGRDNATNLLDSDVYPDRRWYDLYNNGDAPEYDQDQYRAFRRAANDGIAREDLELVVHIARNDLPMSQILTADYTMVNPFSARVYGITDVTFNDDQDPNEYKPGRVSGIPHAGVLTSPMWLNRFPTTDTNRNRHRSRKVWDFFLGTDILQLADRISADTIISFNPTRENPQCNVCHANLDPIAGAFQNWDATGNYRVPEDGWYPEMFAPGFGDNTIPAAQWGSSLQWLGNTISQDPLFNLSMTYIVFTGLTGQNPLRAPQDTENPNYDDLAAAYTAQSTELQRIADAFGANDQNLKGLIKEMVKSPLFRAEKAARGDADGKLLATGTARFLSPEILDRKIHAVTGLYWQRNDSHYLLSTNGYRIFYGGMDSDQVTSRITEPNGIMSSIAMRMANEMGCRTTSTDLQRPIEERRLFQNIEMSYEPFDENGFEITGAVEAIKDQIVQLHQSILGEHLSRSDEEIDRTYQLFLNVWRDGKVELAAGTVSEYLPNDCRVYRDPETGEDLPSEERLDRDPNYTVRAWMAVTTYLLSDYRFLFE